MYTKLTDRQTDRQIHTHKYKHKPGRDESDEVFCGLRLQAISVDDQRRTFCRQNPALVNEGLGLIVGAIGEAGE